MLKVWTPLRLISSDPRHTASAHDDTATLGRNAEVEKTVQNPIDPKYLDVALLCVGSVV